MRPFNIQATDRSMQAAIQEKIDNLNKPKGSLGRLEELAMQVCLIQQTLEPSLSHPCHLLLGGDHGIEREGVYFGKPFIAGILSSPWDNIVTALIILIICAPFLWALMRYGSRSDDVVALWDSCRLARVKLVAFQLLRVAIGAAFVSYILYKTVHWGSILGAFVVLAIVFSIVFSPRLRKSSEQMSKTFNDNLSERERED